MEKFQAVTKKKLRLRDGLAPNAEAIWKRKRDLTACFWGAAIIKKKACGVNLLEGFLQDDD